MTGFLLGLANGTSCIALCAPVLVPYLAAEGEGAPRAAILLGRFMLGRLIGYLLFGMAAGALGSLVLAGSARGLLFGVIYLGLAGMLLVYGFSSATRPAAACVAGNPRGPARRMAARWPQFLPLLLGLLTGLNLCPPFALALAAATETGSVARSLWFFFTFFVGTSVFFLPLPGLGGLRRFAKLRLIARLAAGVVGTYYLYRGVVLMIGGLVTL
jgi:sulfite exporter TauE/SafE